MKVFAVGDVHGDKKLAERLASQAKEAKAELVLLCGDLTMAESGTQGIIGPFKKHGLNVALIPGNHDHESTAQFLAECYDVKNLHGYSFMVGDVGVFGCGGATNVGPHLILSEEETFYLLKKAHEGIKDAKRKVMVTHIHPSEGLIEKMSFEGSTAVLRAIKEFQPDVHLHGHIHEGVGLEEKFGKTKSIDVATKGHVFDI